MSQRWEIDNALDDCGIGHDVEQRLSAYHKALAELVGELARRGASQSTYDVLVNVPTGVLSRASATPEHALRIALVGTRGKFVRWDVNKALELAAAILEDVNAHKEAAAVLAMVEQEAAA